jgi:D-aminoacyl-tRNA deacylase
MKLVVQRVHHASVHVEGHVISEIQKGLLCFVGIGSEDVAADRLWLIKKVLALRVFEDLGGKMNLSVEDVSGQLLLVSQFTLMADNKKGARPSFTKAMKPHLAEKFYNSFLNELESCTHLEVLSGQFGADMKVSLLNDGPITIILDSKS